MHGSCSKYDLYSKSNERIDVEKVKPYYMSLIEKVCASVLDQLILNIFSSDYTDIPVILSTVL